MTTIAQSRTHHAACNLCEAICGLSFTVSGTDITHIEGDQQDPLSRGHICPKAIALKDLYQDPDRLRLPQRRLGSTWQSIGWDDAFALAAEQLAAAYQKDANSVAAYLGNPSVHNYGVMTTASQMLGPLRTQNRYSATSVDQLPHQLIAYWMYGHQLLVPIPDIDHSHFILMLGANPLASNGSLMTVPDVRNRIKALQARGGELVVIDPRHTETATVANAHYFIKPGTDAALLLGMLITLRDEQLVRPAHLAAFTDGLDEALAALGQPPMQALADYCAVPVVTVQTLARKLAAAPAAAVYGRMGVSVQAFGTLCQWLMQLLNLATGNLDREGGLRFAEPALDLVQGPGSKPGSFERFASRVRGLPEFGGELPVAALAEEIETPGAGQIRALVTIAGNPVLSTPNGRRLDAALAGLDFMVSVDFYRNETTRHAHLILPPTMALEHDHYDLIFHHFAVRNTARFNTALFARPDDARHDYEIFAGVGKQLAAQLGQPARGQPRPDQIVDMGLQMSPRKLSLKALAAHPHGLDLGPLQSTLPQRLVHADKRIQAFPTAMRGELARFMAVVMAPAPQASVAPGALQLIGRRHVRSNNSWLHNSQRLVKGPTRHQLWMHPSDLAARGLADGAMVAVSSRVGAVTVAVQASPSMMPGVVSLPHGFGHDRGGVQLSQATQLAGVSCNDLTDEQAIDALSGNAALNGLAVWVAAA